MGSERLLINVFLTIFLFLVGIIFLFILVMTTYLLETKMGIQE